MWILGPKGFQCKGDYMQNVILLKKFKFLGVLQVAVARDTKFSSEFASQIPGCYVNLSVKYRGVSMFKVPVKRRLQSKSHR